MKGEIYPYTRARFFLLFYISQLQLSVVLSITVHSIEGLVIIFSIDMRDDDDELKSTSQD